MADSERSGGVRIGDIAERILKRKVLQGEQENGSPIAPPAPPQTDPIANLVQNETRDDGEEAPQETAPAPVETPKVQETPLVEPVAEPEQQEEERPVVQPVTPRNTRGEERAEKQNAEYVPQNDNTELFAEWENYLANEDQNGTQEPAFAPEQTDEDTPLVTPVQRELGTYPVGTMDFLRENDLPIDWLSTEDGQYWLESRQEQQPEMLFPEDTIRPQLASEDRNNVFHNTGEAIVDTVTGARFPYANDIRDLVVDPSRNFAELVTRGSGSQPEIPVSNPVTGNGYVPVADLRDYPGIFDEQDDFDTQVRIQMDRGYPRDVAERIAAGTYSEEDQLLDLYNGVLPEQESDQTPGAVYDLVADLINASESDGWRTEQASDLYGTLPAINPETPGAEILEQERRDRMNDLVRQIEADDELRDERPDITGQDVKDAIDESQNSTREFTDSLVDFARDVTEPVSTAVSEWANTDNSSYDESTQNANEAALEAGYYPGTAQYDEFVQNLILSEQQAEQEAAALAEQQEKGRRERAEERQNAERESYRQDAIQDLIETYGLNSDLAERIVENPDAYEYNEETGRWGMPGMSRGLSWEDAVSSERLMDDLMLMDAPAVSENGELNTAAQALFLGLENVDENGNYSGGQYPDYGNGNVGLTPEQKLHLFDKGGFFNDSSGITINPDFVNLMAVDSTHASRNPELAKTVKMTDGEFEYEYEKFLEANPMIKLMLDAGMITDEDVIKNFFNNLELTKGPAYNRGGGSGSGYRGYGYGGGGYGYGGGGYAGSSKNSSTPTAKNQNEQRINNIMKNWTF